MESREQEPDINFLTALRRPWRRSRCVKQPDQVLLMKKRNYKVYCDIGTQHSMLQKILTVLDTGAGPNFIRKSELPMDAEVDTKRELPNVAYANDNPIKILGTASIVVRLGHRVVKVACIVCEILAVPMILGCDFCDRFVEGIFPKQKTILMDDGNTVPITRQPLR